jgi:glycosyltransferase involved in cell wall biosynthesis
MSLPLVHVVLMSGEKADAERLIAGHFPGAELSFVSKRELRESGIRGQIRSLRSLRGLSLVFYTESISDIAEPQLLLWTGIFHGCETTILADAAGSWRRLDRAARLRAIPRLMASLWNDACVILRAWSYLKFSRHKSGELQAAGPPSGMVYLYPFPRDVTLAGGAMSHIKGFLSGMEAAGQKLDVIAGREFPFEVHGLRVVPCEVDDYLLRECLTLAYNFQIGAAAKKILAGRQISAIYQRYGRYAFAGAKLAAELNVPLVLEYNGSEIWVAKHWDPARLPRLLAACENAVLDAAAKIIVVSEALKQELVGRKVAAEKIVVNPNGVDPAAFSPQQNSGETRRRLGFSDDDVVVGFTGTFSYWHGIIPLQQAISLISARSERSPSIRFLLIGEGPLRSEMKEHLREEVANGTVAFTGRIGHDEVVQYLAAADVLVSPHVPMPDGTPFFGSPTKLFEYMAMEKAIVASRLDQIAEVLRDGMDAALVPPGDANALAEVIVRLAADPPLRRRLGSSARARVMEHYTWQQNAARVLQSLQPKSVDGARDLTTAAVNQ